MSLNSNRVYQLLVSRYSIITFTGNEWKEVRNDPFLSKEGFLGTWVVVYAPMLAKRVSMCAVGMGCVEVCVHLNIWSNCCDTVVWAELKPQKVALDSTSISM